MLRRCIVRSFPRMVSAKQFSWQVKEKKAEMIEEGKKLAKRLVNLEIPTQPWPSEAETTARQQAKNLREKTPLASAKPFLPTIKQLSTILPSFGSLERDERSILPLLFSRNEPYWFFLFKSCPFKTEHEISSFLAMEAEEKRRCDKKLDW